jgi:hypothetical protein
MANQEGEGADLDCAYDLTTLLCGTVAIEYSGGF